MKKIGMIMIALMLAAVCFAEDAPMRTWTKKSGKTVEGSFVEAYTSKSGDKECIKIKKPDGKVTGIVLAALSEADQAYVKSVSK